MLKWGGGAGYKIELQIILIYEKIRSAQKYQMVVRQTLLLSLQLVRWCTFFLDALLL